MYLCAQKTRILGDVMRTLAEPLDEIEVRRALGSLMLKLLDADYYASFVWDESLQCFDRRVTINMSDRNLDAYEAWYQYRDPITSLMQRQRKPTLVEQVMPQPELIKTEFFNDFLFRDGLYWGVNLYAWDGERNIGDMRIWRGRRRERFDVNTLELLDLIRPAFVAALRRARGEDAAAQTDRDSGAPLSQLSQREHEIVRLASLGLGDKAIAQRLGIGFTTVRTHLGHAFRKLGVDNRVQLAACLNRPRQ